jgi:hypothetical protein
MKRATSILITLTALCTTCIGADPSTPQKEATPQVPPYRSSVVGTDFDFITESDPNTFDRLEDKGQGPAEMPDKSDGSAPLVQEAQPPATPQCEVNVRNAGQMKDVISNVLIRAEHKPESEVAAFLKDAERRYAMGDDLLKAAAEHFKIDQKRLASLVDGWRHINCKHATIPGYAVPDKSDRSAPLVQEAFLFVAHFNDGTRVRLAIDADFKTQDSARQEALRYTPRLGKLPTALRRGVERVVIHKGGENVTAFSDVGLMVLYSDNATKRIGTHDLEETVFHESVHAAWDKAHAKSAEWQDAQKKDGGYVTDYARKNPLGEDLAESALFAYTLLHHPNRIPKEEAARIARIIPNRIAFVEKLLPKGKPLHFAVEAKR